MLRSPFEAVFDSLSFHNCYQFCGCDVLALDKTANVVVGGLKLSCVEAELILCLCNQFWSILDGVDDGVESREDVLFGGVIGS